MRTTCFWNNLRQVVPQSLKVGMPNNLKGVCCFMYLNYNGTQPYTKLVITSYTRLLLRIRSMNRISTVFSHLMPFISSSKRIPSRHPEGKNIIISYCFIGSDFTIFTLLIVVYIMFMRIILLFSFFSHNINMVLLYHLN